MQGAWEKLKEWENAVLGPRLDEIPFLCAACRHGHNEIVARCAKCGDELIPDSNARGLAKLAARYESASEVFWPSAIECYFAYAITGNSLYPLDRDAPDAFQLFQRLQSGTQVSEERYQSFGSLLLAEYLYGYFFAPREAMPELLKRRLPVLATRVLNRAEVGTVLASCLGTTERQRSPWTVSAISALREHAPELANAIESPEASEPRSKTQENLFTDLGTGMLSGILSGAIGAASVAQLGTLGLGAWLVCYIFFIRPLRPVGRSVAIVVMLALSFYGDDLWELAQSVAQK